MCGLAVIDDGLLDVSYLLNCPAERVGKLLQGLRKHGNLGGALNFFGSMRVPWLEVRSPDKLQVQSCMQDFRCTPGFGLQHRFRQSCPSSRFAPLTSYWRQQPLQQLHADISGIVDTYSLLNSSVFGRMHVQRH